MNYPEPEQLYRTQDGETFNSYDAAYRHQVKLIDKRSKKEELEKSIDAILHFDEQYQRPCLLLPENSINKPRRISLKKWAFHWLENEAHTIVKYLYAMGLIDENKVSEGENGEETFYFQDRPLEVGDELISLTDNNRSYTVIAKPCNATVNHVYLREFNLMRAIYVYTKDIERNYKRKMEK